MTKKLSKVGFFLMDLTCKGDDKGWALAGGSHSSITLMDT